MALVFPEQPEVQLGSSKITPRETYSSSVNGMQATYADRMKNAEQLVNALGSLSQTFTNIHQKQQQAADEAAKLQQDSVDIMGGLKDERAAYNGNPLTGLVSGLFSGGAGVSASPTVQAHIANAQGAREFTKFVETDPQYIKLLTNGAYQTNPAQWRQDFEAFIANKRAQFQQAAAEKYGANHPFSRIYLGGFDTASRKLVDHVTENAVRAAVTTTKKVLKDQFDSDLNNNSEKTQIQGMMHSLSSEYGIEPSVATQYAAIENPGLVPYAKAGTPIGGVPSSATGLMMITDARFADIKKRMAASGDKALADSLTDRTDPQQNLRLWAWEYSHNDLPQARGILGREPKTAETYLLWNAGSGDGAKLLNAIRNGSNAPVRDIVGSTTIRNNPSVYGDGSATVQEVVSRVNNKMKQGSVYHTQISPVSAQADHRMDENTWVDTPRWGYTWPEVFSATENGKISSRNVYALEQLSSNMGRKLTVVSIPEGSENAPTGSITVSIPNAADKEKAIKYLSALGVNDIGVGDKTLTFKADAVSKEGETPSLRTWSDSQKFPEERVRLAANEGKTINDGGNYVKASGFNGAPMNPYESQIQRGISQFGLDPVEARNAVFNSQISGATNKAYSKDWPGAMQQLITLETFPNLSEQDRQKINQAKMNVLHIQDAYRAADKNREAAQNENATRRIVQQAISDPMNPPNVAREMFSPTADGQKAFLEAQAMAMNPRPQNSDISKAKANDLTARIESGAFDKELFDGNPPQTELGVMTALVSKGLVNIDDAQKVAATYTKVKQSLPTAMAASQTYLDKISKPDLDYAFSQNISALSNLNRDVEANDAWTRQQRLAMVMTPVYRTYRDSFEALYKRYLVERGVAPDAKELQEINKMATESAKSQAQTIAAMWESKTASPIETKQRQSNMLGVTHAQEFALQKFNDALRVARQRGGGTQATAPELPQGATLVTDNKGNPIMRDGAYQFRLPDRTVMEWNPAQQIRDFPPEPKKEVPPVPPVETKPAEQPKPTFTPPHELLREFFRYGYHSMKDIKPEDFSTIGP